MPLKDLTKRREADRLRKQLLADHKRHFDNAVHFIKQDIMRNIDKENIIQDVILENPEVFKNLTQTTIQVKKNSSLSRPVYSNEYPSEEDIVKVDELGLQQLKKSLYQLKVLTAYMEFKIAEKDFDLTKRAMEIISDSIDECVIKKCKRAK